MTSCARPTSPKIIQFAAPAAAQTTFEARVFHDILEAKAGVREADMALTAISLHLVEETRETSDAGHSLENGIALPTDVFGPDV